MLKEGLNNIIPRNVIVNKNRAKSWAYGYDKKYDVIIISRDGTLGDIVEISDLKIGLPKKPKEVYKRSEVKSEQYWEPFEYPKQLQRIRSKKQWEETTKDFKLRWVDYIEEEFDRREYGFWFYNNGKPTYITGSNYMYLQWAKIDVGLPDYREANRILWLFWEACKADKDRCYGMIYLKIRRSGFSFMGSSEGSNVGTLIRNGRVGILSKTGADAKKMFTDKLVPIATNYPFFFKPIQDGMDKPKTELSYRIPASKITKNNMHSVSGDSDDEDGLNTTIDWNNTGNNSYDSEKLQLLIHDESAKWMKPTDITKNWKVTKTCLRLGRKIIGKCMMGSTSNALDEGGEQFKNIYYDSDVKQRNKNGQTKSGLYKLFIPMEWNLEGFIDRYGMPVMETPKKPVLGIDGEMIEEGAIDFWNNEVESLKNEPDDLNEHIRQFPRTEEHAFRDESKNSLFNLTKIYQQIDYNEGLIKDRVLVRGSFHWKNGEKDTEVVWTPEKRGRFLVSWIPDKDLQNRMEVRGGLKMPGNAHIGSFGCDSYDISGTVGGGASNGALHGLTKYHMENAPSNEFFLEYVARPQTAEIFFEDVLMACVFYGMPLLAENNKPRLLYHFKNRGYRKYSLNRPDKHISKLSATEKELGGIPNSSEAVKQSHASAIETYVEKYVGLDTEGIYRPPDEMGQMLFTRTLQDWAKFDINKRTKFDASISSGLAIMANQTHMYKSIKKDSKISVNFARYINKGYHSEIIK